MALCAVALASCGGSPSAARRTGFTYASVPSVSAMMICKPEAVKIINHDLGVQTLAEPVPTWSHHRYTCPYHYVNGTMVLSVQELPSLATTSAYMAALRRTLGDTGAITSAGQGGFTTTDGSAVTRKDNKVLVVDVGALPAMFGHPATTSAEVAQTVTDVILACWRGD